MNKSRLLKAICEDYRLKNEQRLFLVRMAVIAFQGDDCWFRSGWVFYRLLEDVKKRFVLNEIEDYQMNVCEGVKCIDFSIMEPDLREKFLVMLKVTATDIVADDSNSHIDALDTEGYEMYKNSLKELLGYLEKYENAEWPEVS